MPRIGELRHTSAGNVYRLERMDGEKRYVRRVAAGPNVPDMELWDRGVVYCWHSSQWEEGIPLLNGDTSEYPHFGVFVP